MQCPLLDGDMVLLWNKGLESDEGFIYSPKFNSFHDALADFLKRKEIDLVFAQFGLSGATVLESCKQLSIPVVVHFHGYDAYSQRILMSYREKFKEMFHYASAKIGVSQDMINELITLGACINKTFLAPC